MSELMAVDDKEYRTWIGELKKRYRTTQIKAAVAVNSALIEYYWDLGKDISEKYPGRVRDAEFYKRLSIDLKSAISGATGLSVTNIKYARYFFELYSGERYRQQLADDKELTAYRPRLVDDKNLPQLVEQLVSVPWGHHRFIIDKCKGDRNKALFYVRRTILNGWSRDTLLNWLSTDLYEREGKGQTNFALTMPSDDCDLAQQLVKDPQVFEVFGLKEQHNETELKAAIVANIERTLLSLGKGVAFLGREYPVEIGGETNARSIIVSLRSSILKSSGCQWASPTMSSRRSFRLKPSSRSVTPTPRRNSPQLRLRRRRGGWRNDGLSLQRAVFVFSRRRKFLMK